MSDAGAGEQPVGDADVTVAGRGSVVRSERSGTARTRPNVLLIVSDDHGYADRGCLGVDPRVRTPALDRLAAEGTTGTNAYVTAPICSPSRAALISGRHQARWGATWFDDSAFGEEHRTVAEELVDLGYRTGYFGKVHYGREGVGDRACPPHHGFDTSFYGLAGQQQGRLNYLRHSVAAIDEYGPEGSWRMAVQPMLEGDRQVELEGFLTDELGQRTREFIADADGQPFFAMLAFNAVHNFCWQLPAAELARRGLPGMQDWRGEDAAEYLNWYDGVITPNLPHGREYYLAQLELMDRQIGLILDVLDARGLAKDTLVIYLTDNGGSPCNYGNNAPLRGSKYTLWEGGIRVPFLVRWPGGGIPPGARCQGTISSLDIAPTILAAAGIDEVPPDLDGVDLLGMLRGQSMPEERTLHWECGFQWAVRAGNWKLAHVEPGSLGAGLVRRIEHADPGEGLRLYDLGADPAEDQDLVAERPDIVARLSQMHRRWLAATPLAGIDRSTAGNDPSDNPVE